MTGQRWVLAVLAVVLLGSTGCVCCGNRSYREARRAAPDCDVDPVQANRVYVFAMSSFNPISMLALEGMRAQLNQQGFAKVATGQFVHSNWMAREMRRIRETEPEAIFVVVGFESAAPAAVRLAERTAAEGIPIGAVVVVDSEGQTAAPALGIRTLAVGNIEGIPSIGSIESIVIPDVSSYGLASDERTIRAMGGLLTELAAAVPVPIVLERTRWEYPHAPPVRPEGDPSLHPEWSGLFEHIARATRREIQLPGSETARPISQAPPMHGSAIR